MFYFKPYMNITDNCKIILKKNMNGAEIVRECLVETVTTSWQTAQLANCILKLRQIFNKLFKLM